MIASDFTEINEQHADDPDVGQSILESVLAEAITRRASDLFLLADRDGTTISIRRWGLVEELKTVARPVGRQLVNVVKNWAGMDLVERRRPLDGRIEIEWKGRPVDIRINTLPTLFGEDVTLRLLDPGAETRSLDGLGLTTTERNRILHLIERPSGLILVTGPTGAGKTTTLYACLAHLNDGRRKINTLEDPIEYSVAGIRQSQINKAVDLDFSGLLKSVLRQAPDVVMVGEIRDAETAEAAVRAANSGHLVFATLHAPVAAGAIQSMTALGVEPHFLASALIGAIAQRLVRQLCARCRVKYELPDAAMMFQAVDHLIEGDPQNILYGPHGCSDCGDSGYQGRCGVFEILAASPVIRRLIAEQQPRDAIQAAAVEEGMIGFRQSALVALSQGRTNVAEVVRVIPSLVLDSPQHL